MKKKWLNDERLNHSLFKWLRIMKLTLFFLLAALIHVSASVYSQQTKLSVSLKNAAVKDVLERIEDQSDYFFMYRDEDIDVHRIVNVNVQENPLNTSYMSFLKVQRSPMKWLTGRLFWSIKRKMTFSLLSNH